MLLSSVTFSQEYFFLCFILASSNHMIDALKVNEQVYFRYCDDWGEKRKSSLAGHLLGVEATVHKSVRPYNL